MRVGVSIMVGLLFSIGYSVAQEDEEVPIVLPDALATLDIGNTADGSYPGGATPIKGVWFVEKAAKKLKLEPEPLVKGWLEFGPEIREKGATISALARAPGLGRLRSRIGAGLYGKNGFQIRIDQGKQVVELVRRGIVLQSVGLATDPDLLYEMELTVLKDEDDWCVTGRVWEYETNRPKEPLLSFPVASDDLLFPLAGRPCIVATPFSGEAVQYAIAKVFLGDPYAPAERGEETDSEE